MKNCNCIETLREKLNEHYGGEGAGVMFDLREAINLTTGKTERLLPPLGFTYHKRKKDGAFETNRSKCVLHFSFCPFCGEKAR